MGNLSTSLISNLNQYTWRNGVEEDAVLPARDFKKSAVIKSGNLSVSLISINKLGGTGEKMPLCRRAILKKSATVKSGNLSALLSIKKS
ncbi:hypothetical protein DC081_02890 [Ignatzschineria cameli]|uniref:Uncharacterized protein n=1 Tax=Ignatzschineria cameli TaxID=2182793 RepID=A0A2U2ATS7_9GAMM|nr:hypothetical protein DC080_00900 [Ignatzschineria cameli]PWD88096.1 hypothetical protein DC077_02140 [Ignatzschineria cameli]PWD91127.1 hypothetical protein DC079_02890 [Ignatzschineria cameli]PWD92768.1 hypothetical protein DC081_02890 [Ignatzschineria cameli]PWD93789.1 hypothetical protein DC078_02890 [Ignatzschineria cameli]